MQNLPDLRHEDVEAALTSQGARRVLAHCIRKAASAKDLAALTGIAMASVYRHIRLLQDQHLLIIERSALTPDGKAYDMYRSRVRAARLEVRPGQVDVAWELNAAVQDRLHDMWQRLGGRA